MVMRKSVSVVGRELETGHRLWGTTAPSVPGNPFSSQPRGCLHVLEFKKQVKMSCFLVRLRQALRGWSRRVGRGEAAPPHHKGVSAGRAGC